MSEPAEVGAGGGEAPARQRVTLRRIAELSGVSLATASRVVNGRADVSRETREAVERVARQHGYVPRGSEPATGLVGVTMPYTAPAYFATVLQGASEALHERQLRVVLCPTRQQHDREVSLLEYLSHGATDGALIMLPEESEGELAALAESGYPFVVIDPLRRLPPGVAAVSAANSSVGMQATGHLLALGHRRIAAIAGPPQYLATSGRLQGYHAALVAAGVSPDPRLVVHAEFVMAGGRQAAEQLLGLADPPTAIFAFNDGLALGAMQAARAARLALPEELSVVGVDDTPEASAAYPALTTVRQPLAEMGRMAATLLVRMIESRRLEALHVELETRLVVRESTSPPRAPLAAR